MKPPRRQWNETEEDLHREACAGLILAEHWDLDAYKCHGSYYPFDFFMTPRNAGVEPAVVEVKTKRYKGGSFIISSMKVVNILQYAERAGCVPVLVMVDEVPDPTAVSMLIVTPRVIQGQIEWRGNPRGQPGDYEPCYVIDTRHFTNIGILPELFPVSRDERWQIHRAS